MKRIMVIFCLMACSVALAQAGVHALASERKLNKMIEKRRFLVMVFYNSKHNSPQLIEQLNYEVKQLADMSLYQQGQVFFILIDLAHPRFSSLKNRYGVEKVPAVVFCRDGVALHSERGGYLILSGLFGKEQLEEQIEKYMGQAIKEQAALERDMKNREKDTYWSNYQNIYNGYPFDINIEYQRGPWYGYSYEGGPYLDFAV